jgi:hypothetical protein
MSEEHHVGRCLGAALDSLPADGRAMVSLEVTCSNSLALDRDCSARSELSASLNRICSCVCARVQFQDRESFDVSVDGVRW